MTSSLVGSEMCIRDRSLELLAGMVVAKVEANTISYSSAISACEKGGAVSYTHLTLPTICSV
eukprot:3453881-Prorocentrum_lima.AAC.1